MTPRPTLLLYEHVYIRPRPTVYYCNSTADKRMTFLISIYAVQRLCDL